MAKRGLETDSTSRRPLLPITPHRPDRLPTGTWLMWILIDIRPAA